MKDAKFAPMTTFNPIAPGDGGAGVDFDPSLKLTTSSKITMTFKADEWEWLMECCAATGLSARQVLVHCLKMKWNHLQANPSDLTGFSEE